MVDYLVGYMLVGWLFIYMLIDYLVSYMLVGWLLIYVSMLITLLVIF